MSLPRIAVVAGHGVDPAAWLAQAQLPPAYDWHVVLDTSKVDIEQLAGVLWLWQPHVAQELLQAERESLLAWCRNVIRRRQNELLPFMVVATHPLDQLPEEERLIALQWLKTTVFLIKQVYRHELKGWTPASLIDPSRLTLQVNNPDAGRHLADLFQRQNAGIKVWKLRVRRRAERCLAVGIILVAAYLVILLATIPWTPSTPTINRQAVPVSWSRAEWQYHITDCRQLLQSLNGRSFEKLSPAEQQRFTEHLRWLPISNDVLQQKRPTSEVVRLRQQVHDLLQQMETLVNAWTSAAPASPVDAAVQLANARQLLDGVFEPRQPPTVLHQAARRYWVGERAATVQALQLHWQNQQPLPQKLHLLAGAIRERTQHADSCRVHAPELKTAWLAELSTSIAWLESRLATTTTAIDPTKEDALPSLLREVMK